jgi:hypothetical protein
MGLKVLDFCGDMTQNRIFTCTAVGTFYPLILQCVQNFLVTESSFCWLCWITFWKQIIFINSITHVYISLTWCEYNPKPQKSCLVDQLFQNCEGKHYTAKVKSMYHSTSSFFIVRHLSVMKYITLRQWLQFICKEQYMWQI